MLSKPSRQIPALWAILISSVALAGPCDIYAAGNTPCVAAHSTTRALYKAYDGALYQVKRSSNSATLDIKPLAAGGVANATAQDSFCSGSTCLISIIYDQSGKNNHLTQAPPGGFQGPAAGGYDNLASATGAPVTLNGKKAYGVFIAPGTGYRNNKAVGTAVKDQPQGMYAVLDGTHYNGACCFDYGNAETNSKDTGNGHMETIYFGNCKVWGSGAGNGPWIMADLENGLFSGLNTKQNTNDPTINHRFTTAVVKGKQGHWAIRGGNSVSGSLSTFYDGNRPSANGYNPMSKEGAIILGIGGDNSHSAQGTFYEGVMTSGYPSDAVENEVQADVVAAKYSTSTLVTRELAIGSIVSLQTSNPLHHLVHDDGIMGPVSLRKRDGAARDQGRWIVRRGLGHADCYSFESRSIAGVYLVQREFKLLAKTVDGSKQFNEDATFCTEAGFDGKGVAFRSWNHPTRYVRRHEDGVYAASEGLSDASFDSAETFHEDATWVVV